MADNTQLNKGYQGDLIRTIEVDGKKQQVILAGGIQSTANTTTTALGSAETFTGTFELNELSEVMVSCKCDNTGTLYFDFSNDGTNVDTFPVGGFKVASGIHEFHVAVKGPRYFRVRLVNDTGAQSYLRLYTYYGAFRQGNSPFNQTVGLDADAIHVRPTDFQDEVRIGRRSGIVGWTKFGYREGLTAAAGEETLWATTGNYTPAATAETFDIAYTGGGGSNDGAGSTGALALYFQYIDASGLPAVATHTLGSDGTDTTSFSGLGINRIAVASSGSADQNNALITVTHTSSGNTMAVIPAANGVTQQAIYHVGSNHDAVAKFLWINVGKGSGGGNPKVVVKGYVWNRTVATKFEVFRALVNTATEQTISINEPIGFNLSPADVLYWVADTDTGGAQVEIRFSLNEYQRT